MGIPGFASRIRHHGSISTLGRKGEHRGDHAIIDGPSMAHSLLHHAAAGAVKSKGAVMPRHSYSAIGEEAVAWVDTVAEHGFDM